MGAIELIVAALASGAAAGLKPTGTQAVKDAYAAAKEFLTRKYGDVDLAPLERMPESTAKRASVSEDLVAAGADKDADLLDRVNILVDAVATHEPQAAAAVGVDLEKVKAASLRIRDVAAEGSGVRVRDGEFSGDIEIDGVRAGKPPDDPKKV